MESWQRKRRNRRKKEREMIRLDRAQYPGKSDEKKKKN